MWIVIEITVIFIINSNKLELINHVDFFGYKFCHQGKTMKFRWFYKLLFYDLYFEYYSSNASNIFIQENIFTFIMTYCCNNIFIHTLYFFLYTLLSSTKNKNIFAFYLTNSSITTPLVSSFILSTTNLLNH